MVVFDQPLLDAFKTTETRVEDVDKAGYYTRTLNSANGANIYRLRNRHARPAPQNALSVHREARMADLWPSHSLDHFCAGIEVVATAIRAIA